MIYNIAKSYTDTPGPRFIKEGEYSGEEFREKILIPLYEQAKKNNEKLIIELDGGYGYANSFLEEAFGGLARIYDIKEVLETMEFKSFDMPEWIEDIKEYINDARK